MSNLYRAYSAVHSSEVSDQLNESRDLISDMQFNQLNSSDLQEVAEEILEEMFELSLDIEQSSDIIADILSESLKTSQSDLKSQKIDYIGEAFDAALENGHTVERFLGYRRAKKVQENFHNTSNEDRSSKRLHEALIAQERKAIKEGILSLIEKKTKDSSYLETNMKKRAENNEKARKDMEKMGSMKNPQLEEFSQIRQDWSSAYSSIYEKKLDPVGQEDGDIDNDGDEDKSDKYLAKRRKAIGKAMGKKGDKEEVEEGYKTLPKEKMARQANKAYNKEQGAVRKGDEAGVNKQMQRRIAMQDPAGRKAQLAKEGIDPKGAARMDAAKGKKKETQDQIDKRLMLGKYSPAVKYGKMKKEEVQQVDEGKLKAAAGSVVGGVVGGLVGGPLGAAAGRSAGAALGAKEGRKKEAAVGGLVGGPVGAAIASEYTPKGITFSEAELKAIEDKVNSWED